MDTRRSRGKVIHSKEDYHKKSRAAWLPMKTPVIDRAGPDSAAQQREVAAVADGYWSLFSAAFILVWCVSRQASLIVFIAA